MKTILRFFRKTETKKLKALFIALALISPNALYAVNDEIDNALADVDVRYPRGAFPLTGGPTSVVNSSSFLFTSSIDDYMDIFDWTNAQYENFYLILGGAADTQDVSVPLTGNNKYVYRSGIQGGFAMRLPNESHLGVYINGIIADGVGRDRIDTVNGNLSLSRTLWNDQLIILYGNPSIGGIRFDMIFDKTLFRTAEQDSRTETSENHLITSLSWGKTFGNFTPRATFGVQWPSHFRAGAEETYNNTGIGVLLAVGWRDLYVGNQLSFDLGSSSNTGAETSGYFDNRFDIYYDFAGYINNKLTLRIRPQISMGLNFNENKVTIPPGETIQAPELHFQLLPSVALGAQYVIHQRVSIYTGLRAEILDFVYKFAMPIPNDEAAALDSVYSLRGIDVSGGNIGFLLNPSNNFYIEAGLNNLIRFKADGENRGWSWGMDIQRLSGSLAFTFTF